MAIPKYKDPITGKWIRITTYGQSGNAVEITEISGETDLSDDIITELKNDLNWISYGGGAYRFVSSEEDKRLYSYITEDKISQILVNTLTKTCVLRETQITAASVADSIVKRDSYGEIPVSTPSRDSSATNKAYVDEADKDLRLKLSNLEQALNGYILDTTEEAYADLDSAVLKNSVAVGDNVYPIADKTRALVTRIEGKTTKDENGNIYPAKISGVKFTGKNLFNPSTPKYSGASSFVLNGDEIVVSQTAATTYISANFELPNAKFLIGKKISISAKVKTNGQNNGVICVLWAKGNAALPGLNIISTYGTGAVETKISGSGIVTDIADDTAKLCLFIYSNGSAPLSEAKTYTATYSNIQVEISDAPTPYEPYIEPVSVTLPETYDLHGIGDFKDYLEITKNEDNELYTLKKVQSVGVHEYTGNEAWTVGSDNFTSVLRYYCTDIVIPKSLGDKGICNQYATLTAIKDEEGILFGSSNFFIYLFLNKTNFPDINSVKSYLSAQYAGNNPVVIYYRLSSPVETVITTNLTYEQVTAIRHNSGLIEVVGNTNKAYAKPTIKNTVVYRLTATNKAEG